MTLTMETLIEKIKELGWAVSKDDEHRYSLSKTSPAGQDFNITVEGAEPEEFVDNLDDVYENFDVSYETYLWLDNTGHGINGAPYEMKDVLADMEFCEAMILNLHKKLKEFVNEF